MPAERSEVSFNRSYSPTEFETLKQGHISEDEDDKWFMFYEEPWLYLHRAFTGYCIYRVRFEKAEGSYRVVETLANRDPDQWWHRVGECDALLLAALLDGYAGRDTTDIWEQYLKSSRN